MLRIETENGENEKNSSDHFNIRILEEVLRTNLCLLNRLYLRSYRTTFRSLDMTFVLLLLLEKNIWFLDPRRRRRRRRCEECVLKNFCPFSAPSQICYFVTKKQIWVHFKSTIFGILNIDSCSYFSLFTVCIITGKNSEQITKEEEEAGWN